MIDRRTLPLSALRAFESAASHLHLGRAGENLGVTHSAISHQVKILENRLEVKLFIRANNRLQLTPAGVQLFEAVTQGFDRIIDGTHNLNPGDLSGTLVIGCTQTIATCWAAKHICEFQKKYPMIQIVVKEIQPRQMEIPSEVDIAICYGAPKSINKRVIKLASPALYPVCSPALLGERTRIEKIREISSFTLLHDNQVSWKRWCESLNVPISDIKNNIHFANTSQALTAAHLGYGVALCNEFEIQESIRDGKLMRLSDKSIDEEKSYYLYSRHERDVSLKNSLFEDWITKACSIAF